MGLSPVEEQELQKWFELAKGGDETALSRLVELTQNHLFRFCYYISGNRQRSEDLCQETLIKALTSLDKIEDSKRFLGWTFRVAKNQFIDYTRSSKSKEISIEREEGTQDLPDSSSDQDTAYMVRASLARMSEDERMVIVLVDSEGRTYEEAAQVIGITEEALKSRLFRARKAFLKIFNEA